VDTFDDLKRLVNQQQPGDEVTVEIVRGRQRLKLTVVVASVRES
jgi:S1-C subfamily serine protease